jgi:hypothetical protein
MNTCEGMRDMESPLIIVEVMEEDFNMFETCQHFKSASGPSENPRNKVLAKGLNRVLPLS